MSCSQLLRPKQKRDDCRYELFGARYVVVSDPKVLPKLLDSEKFTMDAHSAAVAGSLSKEAHTALAPAFATEGAKSAYCPSRTCGPMNECRWCTSSQACLALPACGAQ